MSWLSDKARRIVPKSEGAALVGAILYTEEHPIVARVLRDDAFWRSLDSASGGRWAVFAVRGSARARPRVPVSMMVEGPPDPALNREILEDFGLKSTKDWPLLLVFNEDDGGTTHTASVALRGASDVAMHESIHKALHVVKVALERMDDGLRSDPAAVRQAVFRAVKHEREWRLLSGGFAALRKLLVFIPTIS